RWEIRPPPLALAVALQQDAVVAEVVGRADAAVDLRGGEDEAAALAERDDLVHRHGVRGTAVLSGGFDHRPGWYWRTGKPVRDRPGGRLASPKTPTPTYLS